MVIQIDTIAPNNARHHITAHAQLAADGGLAHSLAEQAQHVRNKHLARQRLAVKADAKLPGGVIGQGISELKDLLWKEINDESNKKEIVHRPKEVRRNMKGEEGDLDEEEIIDDDEFEYDDIFFDDEIE